MRCRGATGALIATMLLALSACHGRSDGPISPAVSGSGVVSFRTPDGVLLSGQLFGPHDSKVGIVLAHGATVNQSSWFAIAQELGARGYPVLTFDIRGYCPAGTPDAPKARRTPRGPRPICTRRSTRSVRWACSSSA